MEIKTTYENCKTLIAAGYGNSVKADLPLFLMFGYISQDEFTELSELINPAPAQTQPAETTTTTNSQTSTPATA